MRVKPDGTRRIAELKKGKFLWHIEIPDTGSDDHLKELIKTEYPEIPAIVDQNGGGWKLNKILNEFPHETEARLATEANQEAPNE